MLEGLEQLLAWIAQYKDGVVSLGVVVGAFAFVYGARASTSSSRKGRIAELKERWIERLRTDVTEILEYRTICAKLENNKLSEDQFISELAMLKSTYNTIKLRLNERDQDHKQLIEAINFYLRTNSTYEMEGIETEILNRSRKIINNEWQKAAKGKI